MFRQDQGTPCTILKAARGVVFFEACLFLVLGILAIAVPFFFTLTVELVIGIALLIGGLTQLYRTFKAWGATGSYGALALSLITGVAGGMLLWKPLVGVVALTTLVAIYFFFEACAKMYWAMTLEIEHKGWLFFSGVLSLLLCIIIAMGLPGTALWAIGVLVGVDFLFFSAFLFGLSSALEGPKK